MPHTPGPWRIGKVSGTVVSDYPTSYGTGHDDIDYYGGFCVAESIAKKDDARLIAAAPDLLDALEDFRRWFDDNVSTYEPHCSPEYAAMWKRVRRAIAKAKGEQDKK